MSDRDELLRVDGDGAIHPVGRAAIQRLQPREGEWRLLPSPDELIIARRVNGSGAVIKWAGEICAPGALCDVVALAAQSGWKGELVVITARGSRSFYFDGGALLGATTNIADERLGEVLCRFGVVKRAQLDQIIEASKATNKRLAETAIELGIVSSEQIYAMMVRQVEEVFFAAVQVNEGTFCFFDRFDEKAIHHHHRLSAEALLLEAARRVDEMGYFRQKIPNAQYVPSIVQGDVPPFSDETLKPVFAEIDGAKDIAEIGRALKQSEFEVTRAVFQLVSNGTVVVALPRPRGAEAIGKIFNAALAILYVACEVSGKGKELWASLSRFASGGGVYELFFAGAGPDVDGTFDAAVLAKNVEAFAGTAETRAELDVFARMSMLANVWSGIGGSAPDALLRVLDTNRHLDQDVWFTGLMNDYLSFALFQTESLLTSEVHARVQSEIMEQLAPLRPLLDPGGPPSRTGASRRP